MDNLGLNILIPSGQGSGPVRHSKKNNNRYNPMGKSSATKLPKVPTFALPPLPETPKPMSTKVKTAVPKLNPEDLFAAAFGTETEKCEVALKKFGLNSESDNKSDV
jgi:hypothetical protein